MYNICLIIFDPPLVGHQPTVPGVQWQGVLDATQPGQPCAQAALGIVAGIEDCLNLYVYTPRVSTRMQYVSTIFVDIFALF